MRFCVLGGGSKGNATYVEAGRTRLLIDAGFSGKEIERRLAEIGVEAASLSAILITHEHIDHIRGAAVLSRRYRLPLFANPATFRAAGRELSKPAASHEFETGVSFIFGDFQLHPFSVSHDAADPVGFLLKAGGRMLGHCTDTGVVSRLIRHRLAGCHGLVLECNHDLEMLKNGPYPPALQQRIRSQNGHLANREAVELLRELLHEGLRHVVLSHISETNNSAAIVEATVRRLRETVAAAMPPRPLPRISLADQERVGCLLNLADHDD